MLSPVILGSFESPVTASTDSFEPARSTEPLAAGMMSTKETPTFRPRVAHFGRVHCALDYSIANCTFVEVDGGYVVIDTAPSIAEAEAIKADVADCLAGQVQAIIYTHFHWDHTRGSAAFYRPGVDIWAHQDFGLEMRTQNRLSVAYLYRGAKQFGFGLDPHLLTTCGIGPPMRVSTGPVEPIKMPNRTFADSAATEIGGVRFELYSAPGETYDQIFVWLPDERILIAADNIYKGFPNLYAIRGVPPRPVHAWIRSLDRMRYLNPAPEVLIMGHTEPVTGQDRIARLLTDYRDAIAYVHDSVIRLAERGKTPDEMVQEIRLPPHLRDHPYLKQVYGTLAAGIRGIYSGYIGWFDGNAANLEPLLHGELSARLVTALGGKGEVMRHVENAFSNGDWRWGVWLCDLVLAQNASDKSAKIGRRRALEELAHQTENPLMRHWYMSDAAITAGTYKRPLRPTINTASIADLPIEDLFEAMPWRLKPEKCAKLEMRVGFDFTDSGKQFTFHIRKGVGEVAPHLCDETDFVIRASEADYKTLLGRELKPWTSSFWKRIQVDAPGNSIVAPFRKLRWLARLSACMDRP